MLCVYLQAVSLFPLSSAGYVCVLRYLKRSCCYSIKRCVRLLLHLVAAVPGIVRRPEIDSPFPRMTTRSGAYYKMSVDDTTTQDSHPESTPTVGAPLGAGADLTTVMQMFLEDRQRLERELAEERRRRDRDMEERVLEMQHQMAELRSLATGGARTESGVDSVKLTKLSPTDDIEAYLTTFERLMRAYDIPEVRWALKLAPQLTGKAQQAYAAMEHDRATDYAAMKAAILHRYEITEETYRQRFRTAKRKEGEMQTELVIRLKDAARNWMKKCTTREELFDAVVLEQFVNTLEPAARVWVKERKPDTSADAARLADDYEQARTQADHGTKKAGRPHEPRKCFNCGKMGHLARDCMAKPKTESLTPAVEETQQPKTEKRANKSELKCFNCGEKGHISRRCPSNAALLCQTGRLSVGSRASSGVSREGLVEGQAVTDILLDTGCSQTLVKSDLVPTAKRVEGDAVTIRCAHGDTVLYPLAEVEMVVDGIPLQVEAAVSDTLPVSVLLGTDVPELNTLLGKQVSCTATEQVQDALIVTTRAQARRRETEDVIQL